MTRTDARFRVVLLPLLALLVGTSAGCFVGSSECKSNADCADGERCLLVGGVFWSGGQCAPKNLFDASADAGDTRPSDASDAGVDAADTSDTGRDVDTGGPDDGGPTDSRDTADTRDTTPPRDTADSGPPQDTSDSGADTAEADACATSEMCDGMDNDCDGAIDEGCPCTFDPDEMNNVDTDGSHGSGVCQNQTRNDNGVCPRPNLYEAPESTCTDASDNDCDGQTDRNDSDCDIGSKEPGSPCSSRADCKNGPCVSNGSRKVCAHVLFTTSSTFTGNVGTLTGMDAECDSLAQNAGRPGTWKAVASSSNDTAKSRLSIVAPVYNSNGQRIADDAADLWSGTIQNRPNFDESGSFVSGQPVPVWTGTAPDGTASGNDCVTWTNATSAVSGDQGEADKKSSAWLDATDAGCNVGGHLYCIDGQ